jgi:hypothetical protein
MLADDVHHLLKVDPFRRSSKRADKKVRVVRIRKNARCHGQELTDSNVVLVRKVAFVELGPFLRRYSDAPAHTT